ncbi:MAG TPA: hypothetical protein VIM77_06685, partial [Mucilaginibacter sp.]
LDYNYYLLTTNNNTLNTRDVQLGLQVLNGLADFSKEANQTALFKKFDGQLKDYVKKFQPLLGQQ